MKSDEFDQDIFGSDSASSQDQGSQQFAANGGVDPASAAEEGAPRNDELEELRDRYLRLAAEYDNYRKRTDRERLETRDRAQGQLVEKLLESLDDLQRVAGLSGENTSSEAVLEGVRLVERKFTKALEAAGLELVEARGARFDPSVHDALMMAPTEDVSQDDTVGEVFQSGYRFRGALLRPARVQVRKHG
jgi:molecular chaperone GrpE